MPEYDADILTGAERSTNSRPVAVMVNNIANSQRQNAAPSGHRQRRPAHRGQGRGRHHPPVRRVQRRDSVPEVGPLRSGRDQFLQLLMPWNILYYHDGESIFCTQFVSVYGYSG